jgi:hypothetical protein
MTKVHCELAVSLEVDYIVEFIFFSFSFQVYQDLLEKIFFFLFLAI